VIVPVKTLPHAKSRLAPASTDEQSHARLVTAMRRDTLHAARNAGGVARVIVVADRDGDPVADLVQSRPGLNEGIAEAARMMADRWPADGVAALVGDLPALRADDLAAALAEAAAHPRAFVADAAGTGTTLVTARPGVSLRPAFGPGSAVRHAADAVAIDARPGLRADVDTVDDLARARLLGLGRSTRLITSDSPVRCMMTP
jgi:2-phospho-L-lactate guanylyltransferase